MSGNLRVKKARLIYSRYRSVQPHEIASALMELSRLDERSLFPNSSSLGSVRAVHTEHSGSTTILSGNEKEIQDSLLEISTRAASDPRAQFFKIVFDQFGLSPASDSVGIINALQDKYPNYKVSMLSDIQQSNVKSASVLLHSGIEVRHLEGIKANFGVTGKDYVSYTQSLEKGFPKEIVWSNNPEMVAQMQDIYQKLWESAIPAEQRIRQLEAGTASYHTRVLRDPLEILAASIEMINSSNTYSVSSVSGGILYAYHQSFDQFEQVLGKARRGEHRGIRWVTTVDEQSKDIVKAFINLGMQVKHIPDVPMESFGFSESEVGVTVSRLEGGGLNSSALFSNEPMYIDHYASIFAELWERGVDAQQRIKEIEEGIPEPRMRILRNHAKIEALYVALVNQAKNEILLIMPSKNSYVREIKIGVIEALNLAAMRGVNVRMLAPDPPEDASRDSLINHKIIRQATTPNTVTVLVIDRTSSLIIEQQDDSKLDFAQAIGVATFSSRGSTVKANIRFFERMWEEVEEKEREKVLLEKERKSRREAQLLQDILTHDIRNYSQVTKLSAELIHDELKDEPKVNALVQSLVQSIDGMNKLLDRAKQLGKVMSEERPRLVPIDLRQTIETSLSLVKMGSPGKKIIDERKVLITDSDVESSSSSYVVADDLLHEVFANLYSNAVNYSEGSEVRIETSIEESVHPDDVQRRCWKVVVSDHGRGIPEESKDTLFSRYLENSKGSGLGMSIVQALVVDRYNGKVKICDRVRGDYSKGASVEVWLPKASNA